MFFLLPLALFVVPAAGLVLGRQAKIPMAVAAGVAYRATVVASKGYEEGEGPFTPRFNEAGIDIGPKADSDLGKQISLLAEVYGPLKKHRNKRYFLTESEGQYLNQLTQAAVAAYRVMKFVESDLRQFMKSLTPEVITPENLEAIGAAKASLADRFQKTQELVSLACRPVAAYLVSKRPRLEAF